VKVVLKDLSGWNLAVEKAVMRAMLKVDNLAETKVYMWGFLRAVLKVAMLVGCLVSLRAERKVAWKVADSADRSEFLMVASLASLRVVL